MEEFESGSKPVDGISTSIAGFVGMAERGPVEGAPELVTSFAEFQRKFGGYLNERVYLDYRYMPLSVEQFFANGGARAFIMRVAPEDARAASASLPGIQLEAANPGAWGNKISVLIQRDSRTRLQLIEKKGDRSYTVKSLNGIAEGDTVLFGSQYNRIEKISDRTVQFELPFEEEPLDMELVATKYVHTEEMRVRVKYDSLLELYDHVSLNPNAAGYIEKVMAKSSLVKVIRTDSSLAENNLCTLCGEVQDELDISFGNGTDGDIVGVGAAAFMGTDKGPGQRTGIQSFLENSFVNIMAVPGITIPDVVMTLVSHCENAKSRFAVLDIPKDSVKTDDVIQYRNLVDSSYAAMYHPWLQVYDPGERKTVYLPPSGAVMGVYSRTDVTRGVHKAPANETVSCSALSSSYNKGEQDLLNPQGVNLIRQFPGQGIRIWGARTASSDPAFRYVNVRRLFIYIEESIKAATNWVVFEPNQESLWGRVQRTVEAFLTTQWRSGALAGASPGEAFFVDVSRNTMTQEDINNGRLICKIGIAPSRPAEFVIFRVTQIMESEV